MKLTEIIWFEMGGLIMRLFLIVKLQYCTTGVGQIYGCRTAGMEG